jgi:hypothetical protein
MGSAREGYEELSAYTLARADQAFIHQHVVDAFAAQSADETTKPITLTFALVGLYLHVEKCRTGRRVQMVHLQLAQRKRTWPTWPLPSGRGAMNADDVMRSAPGAERDKAIDAWCASVWQAFSHHRDAVVMLLKEYGLDG